MRCIYLIKFGQVSAVIAVVWFFLSVSQFCGDVEVEAAIDHDHDDVVPTESQHTTLHKGVIIRVRWSFLMQREPHRIPSTHWASKIDEIRLKKQNTNSSELHATKDNLSQVGGELGNHTTDDRPQSALRIQIQINQESEDKDIFPTTEGPITPATTTVANQFQRFKWYADGCISVSVSDFFSTNPQTHAGKIVAQLMWSVILVACHAFVILFHIYLVYASYLPPSGGSDLVRSLIGMFLWYIAFGNLIYVHYYWKADWAAANVMISPEFPSNWVNIEFISGVMLLVFILEVYFCKWSYSNVRIVSIKKKMPIHIIACGRNRNSCK